jgi:hypothetical protein
MTNELTDEAKAEIAEAIRIVREDKFETYIRTKHFPTKAPETEPPVEGDPNKIEPPPRKEPEVEPPKKKGLYWGDQTS